MKLIHCGDLHLDSKMTTHLQKEQAKMRQDELLHTYERMIMFAKEEEVSAILIAGDLFDVHRISAKTRNVVYDSIRNNPDIDFYYLKGNHDHNSFLEGELILPDNLFLFDTKWKTYRKGNVAISGVEFDKQDSSLLCSNLALNQRAVNIVLLHGQESGSNQKDKTEIIPIQALKNKGIDYLALGHVHGYKKERLDARGVYCYSGCLEGRGFDECGEHGFVLLDVDEKQGTVSDIFIPFAKRNIYEIPVEISKCMTSWEILNRCRQTLSSSACCSSDLVRILLTGKVDVACEKDADYVKTSLEQDYFYLDVKDETSIDINPADYLFDESLKGEFVRTISGDEFIPNEEKSIVIRYGLQALAGEKVQ